SVTTHIWLGTNPTYNAPFPAPWSISDFGLWKLKNDSSPGQTIFTSADYTNMAAGYPAEVIAGVDVHGEQQIDVVPMNGMNPEVGILGNLSGILRGTTSVTGPVLKPPYAAICTASHNATAHSPGNLTVTLSWLRSSAPASSVTFTPTSTTGTFSPSAITLT